MLTVKLLGIVLIVVSSSFIGFLKSNSLTNRYKKLSLFYDGINILYDYIEQGGYELDIAIKNSFSKCVFLKRESDKLLCFDADLKKDKKIIEEFFVCLGTCTKRVECDRINAFRQKIKTHLKEAQNDILQKSKIYQTFGICIGLTVAILLI